MDKYFLHTNEPCTQDWGSMTTVAKGKFCNNCNKTVFDFTTSTDGEIIKHVEAMKGEMFCGRFEENQLDRWIEKSNIKTINPRLYKFLISFMLLSAAHASEAQTTSSQENGEVKKKVDKAIKLTGLNAPINAPLIYNKCDTANKNLHEPTRVMLGRVRPVSSNEPLYIVDGVPLNHSQIKKINPDKIRNVSVLKSAESTVLYGSAAANGVIILQSKYTKKELKEVLQ
jgi:TonB-dependent SusC/RagA subfamily outer membrane receptor